jgi:hypothetical protein
MTPGAEELGKALARAYPRVTAPSNLHSLAGRHRYQCKAASPKRTRAPVAYETWNSGTDLEPGFPFSGCPLRLIAHRLRTFGCRRVQCSPAGPLPRQMRPRVGSKLPKSVDRKSSMTSISTLPSLHPSPSIFFGGFLQIGNSLRTPPPRELGITPTHNRFTLHRNN